MLARRDPNLGALILLVFALGAVDAALLAPLAQEPRPGGLAELAAGALGLPAAFFLTAALSLPLLMVLSSLQRERSLYRDYQSMFLGFVMALVALFLFYPVLYLGSAAAVTGVFRLFRRMVFFFLVSVAFVAAMTEDYERSVPRSQAAILAGFAASVYVILAFFQLLRALCPGIYEALLDI